MEDVKLPVEKVHIKVLLTSLIKFYSHHDNVTVSVSGLENKYIKFTVRLTS